MFKKLLASLQKKTVNDDWQSRRQYERRSRDKCVTIIDGQTYPVENWSFGGLLIAADTRSFGLNQECDIHLKFKLQDRITDITQTARIIRKEKNKIAFQFTALTDKMRQHFQSVVDDSMAEEFVTSQT